MEFLNHSWFYHKGNFWCFPLCVKLIKSKHTLIKGKVLLKYHFRCFAALTENVDRTGSRVSNRSTLKVEIFFRGIGEVNLRGLDGSKTGRI